MEELTVEHRLKIAIKALQDIQNPIAKMRRELEEDEVLNGVAAINLSKDHTYLKDIAKNALDKIVVNEADKASMSAYERLIIQLKEDYGVSDYQPVVYKHGFTKYWHEYECYKLKPHSQNKNIVILEMVNMNNTTTMHDVWFDPIEIDFTDLIQSTNAMRGIVLNRVTDYENKAFKQTYLMNNIYRTLMKMCGMN